MKEDNTWDQRVLEAPRAEENEESIVEMLRRLDQQFDKLTAKFQASMAEINKNCPKQQKLQQSRIREDHRQQQQQ